jgi:predicted transposase YbfD/YdcC
MESVSEVFFEFFSEIDDPRSWKNQIHDFIALIGTTFCAILSGFDSFCGMADYVEMHFDELSQHFDLSGGVPSHDTYQRFWEAISPEQFYKYFFEFIESLQKVNSDVINIDGKTIRNSGKEKPLHIVSAWCQNNQMVFAQEKVHAKSNEITAIPRILKRLDLKNKVITIDAMGAQRSICQQIVDGEGDYVISLKGNQGTLHEDVQLFLDDVNNHELIHESNDKGHGRIEQRIAIASQDIEWLQERHNWPGLKSIGMVTSTVTKKGKETVETRFYISSLEANAERLNDVARKHWGIENQLHWRLDVVFNEDKACIRNDNAAENMDILRKWALTILIKAKKKPQQSVKSVMRRNAMSFPHLVNVIKQISHA